MKKISKVEAAKRQRRCNCTINDGGQCVECKNQDCPFPYCQNEECLECSNRIHCPMCKGQCSKCEHRSICNILSLREEVP